jgi:prophage regulatory protein
MTMLRLAETLRLTGGKRSLLYRMAADGLFTSPVKLVGARASGWPDYEVKAIVAARIAGADVAEIRSLVVKLHSNRAAIYRDALRQLSENREDREHHLNDAALPQKAKTVRRGV